MELFLSSTHLASRSTSVCTNPKKIDSKSAAHASADKSGPRSHCTCGTMLRYSIIRRRSMTCGHVLMAFQSAAVVPILRAHLSGPTETRPPGQITVCTLFSTGYLLYTAGCAVQFLLLIHIVRHSSYCTVERWTSRKLQSGVTTKQTWPLYCTSQTEHCDADRQRNAVTRYEPHFKYRKEIL